MASCEEHTRYATDWRECRRINRHNKREDAWEEVVAPHAPIEIACCGQFRPLTGPDYRTPCCGRDWFAQEVTP